jgi:DNA-binding transcriptional ArsR family regulator
MAARTLVAAVGGAHHRARVSRVDLDPIFTALADPTRRSLFERLTKTGAATATRLAHGLPITRQAVVKHLQVLADSGLVSARREGREVLYAAETKPLDPALQWLVDAGAQWDKRLDRLRDRAAPPSAAQITGTKGSPARRTR